MSGAIFLKLDGIDGEATEDGHEDEIEVQAWSWGMAQDSTGAVGRGSAVGKVSVQDLNITKYMDSASPTLALACCVGTRVPKATLTVQRASEDRVQALKIEMENILVSSYAGSDGADSGTLPMENVTLSFKKFKYIYTPQKEDGSADAEVEVGFDIEKNVKEK